MSAQQLQVSDTLKELLGESVVSIATGILSPSTAVPAGVLPTILPKAQKPAIAKVGYSHLGMIDMILANPGISQNRLADHFSVTPSWISQIISSDAFQIALANRRKEIVDPLLIATVEENFQALVSRSQDILMQKLNRSPDQIPDQLALRTLEIAGRAAGYGVRDQPVAPQSDVMSHLEALGGGLVALLAKKRVEAEVIQLPHHDIEGDFTDANSKTAK